MVSWAGSGLSAGTAQSSKVGPGANVDRVRTKVSDGRYLVCPHCSAGWLSGPGWGAGAPPARGQDRAGRCAAPPWVRSVRSQLRYGRGDLGASVVALVVVGGL